MQIYHWGRRDDKAKASISFQVWPWETGGKSLNRKCLIQSVFKMRNSSLSIHNEAKLLLQLKKALDWGPWVCGTLVPWPCPRLDLPALPVTQDRCGRLITACVTLSQGVASESFLMEHFGQLLQSVGIGKSDKPHRYFLVIFSSKVDSCKG